MNSSRFFIALGILLPALHAQSDWSSWGRGGGNQRFSPLKLINTSNVSMLVPAWQHSMKSGEPPFRPSESTPLVVGDGATDRMFRAFDTKTGKELWSTKTDEVIRANPVTYAGKDGKPYVAVAAGTTFLTFKLP